MPLRAVGATLVWSSDALRRSVIEYPHTRRWPVHRILHKLMEHNAPVQAVANISEIAGVEGPLLVANPHLLGDEERDRLLRCANPIIAVGPDFAGWPDASSEIVDSAGDGDAMRCRLYHASADVVFTSAERSAPPLPADRRSIPDPPYFRYELVFTNVSKPFLEACAKLIRQVSDSFSLSDATIVELTRHVAEIGVMMVEQEPGVFRIALRNMDGIYGRPKIKLGRRITKIVVRSPFPVTTVRPSGDEFTIVVPTRGIVVCDVYTGQA
jgi:hypothetical protein